jgi:mitochondrial fission protein ELM1
MRDLDDTLAPYDAKPLRETARVAEEVRRRLTVAAQPARSTAT